MPLLDAGIFRKACVPHKTGVVMESAKQAEMWPQLLCIKLVWLSQMVNMQKSGQGYRTFSVKLVWLCEMLDISHEQRWSSV